MIGVGRESTCQGEIVSGNHKRWCEGRVNKSRSFSGRYVRGGDTLRGIIFHNIAVATYEDTIV